MTYLIMLSIYILLAALIIVFKIEKHGTIWKNQYFQWGLVIAWFDLWIGAYRKPNGCWFFMIPTIGFTFTWYNQKPKYLVYFMDELKQVIVCQSQAFKLSSSPLKKLAKGQEYTFTRLKAIRRAEVLSRQFKYELKDHSAYKSDEEFWANQRKQNPKGRGMTETVQY